MAEVMRHELWKYGVITFVQRGPRVSVQCSSCGVDLERAGRRGSVLWKCPSIGCLMSYVPGNWDGPYLCSSVLLTQQINVGSVSDQDWMKKWFECWTGMKVEVSIEWR